MDDVVREYWADIMANDELISIRTRSGYGRTVIDPKGVEHLLLPSASNQKLGAAMMDALQHSRWVIPAPREDFTYHPDIIFEKELYNLQLNRQRYMEWIAKIMRLYGYKTKRALFRYMKNCSAECKSAFLTIKPSHHEKLEAWSGTGNNGSDNVIISVNSLPEEIGAAIRLTLSRCS